MSTVATAPSTSHVEELASAVAAVAKRLRIQDYPVVGIQAAWNYVHDMPEVKVQVEARTHAIAVYFNLRDLVEVEGTTIYRPERVTGLPAMSVGVYGPADLDAASVS